MKKIWLLFRLWALCSFVGFGNLFTFSFGLQSSENVHHSLWKWCWIHQAPKNAPFHTIFEYLWGSKWLSAEAEKWIRLFQFCLNINHNSYTQKFSFFSFFSKMEFFSYYYQIAIFLWNILVCRKHIDFEEKVFLFLVLEKCKHILKQITSPMLNIKHQKRRKKNSKCFSFFAPKLKEIELRF